MRLLSDVAQLADLDSLGVLNEKREIAGRPLPVPYDHKAFDTAHISWRCRRMMQVAVYLQLDRLNKKIKEIEEGKLKRGKLHFSFGRTIWRT